jgi:hypothetical protein
MTQGRIPLARAGLAAAACVFIVAGPLSAAQNPFDGT